MAKIFRKSRLEARMAPRVPGDAEQRKMAQGPLVPMEERGFLARLFRRR